MTLLTELIIKSENANRILSAGQLERLPGGSKYRRCVRFNRVLKAGELLQVRRGFYLLSNNYRIEYHSSVGWVSDSVTRHILLRVFREICGLKTKMALHRNTVVFNACHSIVICMLLIPTNQAML